MLERIKQALRISGNSLDSDISENIAAAAADLLRRGVDASAGSTDKLVIKAVELYCKWMYDYLGKGEQWFDHYEKLTIAMSQAEDYASEEYWE